MYNSNSINGLLDLALRNTAAYIQGASECAAYAEGMAFGYGMLLDYAVKIEEKILETKKLFISVDDLSSVKTLIKLDQLICKTCPALCLSSYEYLIKPKILAQAKIEVQLDILEEKMQNLKARNCLSAAIAAQQIITDLHELNNRYFVKEEIKDIEYTANALEIIDKNKPILEEHRNYNYIIANIVLAILTAGTALLFHKVNYGNFLFFSETNSMQKIKPLKQLIANQNEMQFNSCIKSR